MIDKDGKEFAGYVNSITLPDGRIYKLQCEVVEIYDTNCRKCGSPMELKFGEGKCPCCGTQYTTQFRLVEKKILRYE